MDETLPWVMSGFLSNTGQVCVAQTRVLVHESRKEELVSRLQTELEQVSTPPLAHDCSRRVVLAHTDALLQVKFAEDPLTVDEARMETERHRPLGPIVNESQYK